MEKEKMEKLKLNNVSGKINFGLRKVFIKNSSIPPEARLLLIILMTYKGKNQFCWPSQGTLSKNLGRNKESVRKYLKILQEEGNLKIKSRGIGRSKLYYPSYTKIHKSAKNLAKHHDMNLAKSYSTEV